MCVCCLLLASCCVDEDGLFAESALSVGARLLLDRVWSFLRVVCDWWWLRVETACAGFVCTGYY